MPALWSISSIKGKTQQNVSKYFMFPLTEPSLFYLAVQKLENF